MIQQQEEETISGLVEQFNRIFYNSSVENVADLSALLDSVSSSGSHSRFVRTSIADGIVYIQNNDDMQTDGTAEYGISFRQLSLDQLVQRRSYFQILLQFLRSIEATQELCDLLVFLVASVDANLTTIQTKVSS
jgi:hypothetical protein